MQVAGDAVVTGLLDGSGKRKYLNEAERWRFLGEVERMACESRRAFCLTLFYTGCRISEALALQRERIDFADGTLVLRTLKQRRAIRYRTIPVPEDLLALLRRITAGRLEDDPVWEFSRSTGWRIVRRCMKAADLTGPNANPRGLRHSFATACTKNGVPLPTVQKWMGHARLKSTAIYLNFVGNEERTLAKRLWRRKKEKPTSERHPTTA